MKPLRASLLVLLVAAPAGPSMAAASHTYSGVTPAVFACVKSTSMEAQGTVYVETEANHGTATTTSTLWSVVMDYVFSPETQDLQYWMVHKTWVVPADAVWSGIAEMIASCRAAQS